MLFFNDTCCQLCERFITKKHWNQHLYSSRPFHREVDGYWTAYFPERKLTRHESDIVEKAFWKMLFATRDTKEVEEF